MVFILYASSPFDTHLPEDRTTLKEEQGDRTWPDLRCPNGQNRHLGHLANRTFHAQNIPREY
jgi:hypothetical protein